MPSPLCSLSVIVYVLFVDAVVYGLIQWKEYDGKHLKPATREFYRYAWDVYIPVPRKHSDTSFSIFDIYVRKFSATPERSKKHLWLISGGPGSSTSGIERALTVKLMDTTIYIMDNRGLGHSHKLCHHSESTACHMNPKKCYESVDYSPKDISMHETAKDYNYISRMILNENSGGEFYMYGSSYGATLAYTAFKYDPFLYAGLLLESFMPEFRLHGSADVRKHAIDSCYRSETCRSTFGQNLKRSDAEKIMETILNKDNRNECKAAIEFMAGNRSESLNSLLNSYTRFAFYTKTKLRAAFLPLIYDIAFCPNLAKFNVVLSEFHGAYQKHIDESSSSTETCRSDMLLGPPPSASEMHCSTGSRTNHFFGNHIRFSEFMYESDRKFKKCIKTGYLRSANWADVCGMVSGWKEDYRPYLYVPEVPKVSRRSLESSQTRVVIVTGKLDTQTPHDLAQREFDRLPLGEKYMFTADHGGHGIIDEWEVPGLSLHLMLSFTMSGSEDQKQRIESLLADHNSQADRIWQNWDRNVFHKSTNEMWNFTVKPRQYSWWMFASVLGGSFLVPLVTLLLQDIDDDSRDKTLL